MCHWTVSFNSHSAVSLSIVNTVVPAAVSATTGWSRRRLSRVRVAARSRLLLASIRVLQIRQGLDLNSFPIQRFHKYFPIFWPSLFAHLYEDLYCARGEMENRIKEQQLGLFADRTSSATLRANQLRLYFSSFAYVLLHGLRRLGLTGTAFAKAQSTTIRLKLLKIGARLRLTARKVWLSFSEAYPYASDIAQILANLKQHPAWSPPG